MKQTINSNILKKKRKELFIIIFFFVIGIIIPSYISIKGELYKEIVSKQYNLESSDEIIKDSQFEEKIFIPKHVKKYGIMFNTYGRKNKGLIRIEIFQKNKKTVDIVNMEELKDNDYYYLNTKNLQTGEAFLNIRGVNGVLGNSISVYKTKDIIYGEMFQNGKTSGTGFIHKIIFYEFNKIVKLQFMFFILTVISYLYLSFLFYNENKKKNEKKIYCMTVLFIFFMLNIKAPSLTFNAQPYAEQVFNFMYNGIHKSFIENVLLMDAGYLPLYQRLIGLCVIKLGFNIKLTGILMSNIAILVVAFMVSCFTLNCYKKYGNILFRFIICIVFGVFNILSYTETHTFIDFSYMNIVLIIFISLLNFKKIKKRNYILIIILTFFLCISKSYYVILLPICVFILVFFWKKMIKKEKIYLMTISIATVFQIIYTYRNIEMWIKPEKEKLSIFQILNMGTHQAVQQFINLFFSELSSNFEIENINIMFLFIFTSVIIFIIYLSIKNKDKEGIILLSLIALVLGNSYFNVLSGIWGGENLWTTAMKAINSRHAALVKISLIGILILLPYSIEKLNKNNNKVLVKKEKNIFCFIIIIFLLIRYSAVTTDSIYKSSEIYSDWNLYSKFYQTGEFVIPIEPYFLFENKKAYYIGEKTDNYGINAIQGEKYFIENNGEGIQEIILPKPIKIEYLYTRRVQNYNFNKIRLIGFDKDGNTILDLVQLNRKEKSYVGFKNDNPDKEITKISFITDSNIPAYILPEIIIGEPLN